MLDRVHDYAIHLSLWSWLRGLPILAEGGNRYKMPHMGKKKLRNRWILPQQITVSEEAINIALEKLGHI